MCSFTTPPPKQRHNLTHQEREQAFATLLAVATDGKLPKGSISSVAAAFQSTPPVISRLWRRGLESLLQGSLDGVYCRRRGRSGRRSKLTPARRLQLTQAIERTPHERRGDLRTLAASIAIPKSTLHDYKQQGALRRHTNAVRPLVTPLNMIVRLEFVLGFVRETEHGFEFDPMLHRVHLDEKWFLLKRVNGAIYLSPTEAEPHRVSQSKTHIEKVMVLVAVARPRFAWTRTFFDGKIGAWPFVEMVAAKRSSKNRPAGTLEMKNVSVDRDRYRDYLITKVIPAIRAKWPRATYGKTIIMQQDNAKPHVLPSDSAVLAAGARGGWNITLEAQPANSPDMNVLDLGFFASIQALQQKKPARTTEHLVANVEEAFAELETEKLDRVFLTLQSVMEQTMLVGGSNQYKIPHLQKNHLIGDDGLLPLSLPCAVNAARRAVSAGRRALQKKN